MNNELLTGLVTGPNLFSYIGTPTLQDHNDIADCNNIATRSADLGHGRYANPKGWFEEYARTLNFLGWSLYDDAIHTRTQHLLTGSVADFLVESAHGMKDARQANAMIDTLDTLKTDHPAILSFGSETQEGETFQIVPARYDSQGNLHIALFKLELSVEIKQRNFLFWNWERRSARIIQRRAFLKLDRSELDNRRTLINRLLNEHLMRRFALRKTRLVNY